MFGKSEGKKIKLCIRYVNKRKAARIGTTGLIHKFHGPELSALARVAKAILFAGRLNMYTYFTNLSENKTSHEQQRKRGDNSQCVGSPRQQY